MAYLTSINGSSFGKRLELDRPKMVMGRHPECELTLDSGSVSRQHACINALGKDFLLEDLKSRNGTFLNGRLITEPTRLSDGDLIRICDLEFSFHAEDDSSALVESGLASGGSSSFGILMVDDTEGQSSSRAVTGKVDIRGTGTGSQLTTSSELRLQALIEITHNLARAVALDEVLPKVLDTLFKIFVQADRAFIVLKGDSGELVPKWVKTRQQDQQEAFRISRTVMKEVMESKQAIMSLDASSDERFEMANSVADFRIRSMVVAPLLDSEGEPIGAIQMDTLNARRRFEAPDLEILASIASQAGVAIENAQLHEKLILQRLVEQDLQLARSVQRAFLPATPPDIHGYIFHDFYEPAQQIGGDYFDYIPLPDGRLAVIVADVVGHGVAAAMLMAKLSTETRFSLASQPNGAKAISLLNRVISNLGVEKFITFLCLILDPNSNRIEIINAGHMAPLWKTTTKRIIEPGDEQAGVPIGIIDDFEYEMSHIEIESGEQLLLYTDGINEAPNAAGKMFGIARIQDLMLSAGNDVDQIGSQVVQDLKQFVLGTEQADDMCLVVIGRI
jgi:sigma-B regulation protein RsbU (phosphoserine phosphatase)